MISPLFRMEGDEARGLLFGLLESDKIQLRKYPDMPSVREMISDGRVKYDAYDPKEHWKTYKEIVDEVRRDGVSYGDCEDLAVAVAAEDQVFHGVQSLPYAYSPRPGLFHVVTAVPGGSISSGPASGRTRVSGTGPPVRQLPNGFHGWPVAMGADTIPGYVLQDPSRAAGMGTFGYAPNEEAGMAYGAEDRQPRPPRRHGRGLGGIVQSFQQGVLGGGSARSVASELGEGIRKGSGLGSGWAGRLGEELPGQLGVGPVVPSEGAAVRSMKKGLGQRGGGEAPSHGDGDGGDDMDEDLDLADEGGDEDFGGIDDVVLSEMFGADDDGLDDDLDDEGGGGGGFHMPKLPSWALPAAIGTGAGAAAVGVGVALSHAGRRHRKDKFSPSAAPPSAGGESEGESMGLDDAVLSEMFGGDDEDDDEDFSGVEDGPNDQEGIVRAHLHAAKEAWDTYTRAQASGNRVRTEAALRAYGEARSDYESSLRSLRTGRQQFAGVGTLRRTDLFGGDFSLSGGDKDDDDLFDGE